MNEAPAIAVRGAVKAFDQGKVLALNGADLDVRTGEFVAIVGPSGCGKSTLLHLIAALDRPDEGSIEVQGHELSSDGNLSHFRARDVGIVFQLDNLIPTLSAAENVQVPMFEAGFSAKERVQRAEHLLEQVGLARKGRYLPAELSGGERQRVAIARALANDPPLILADEPTGRLDSKSGELVLDLLERLRRERNLTVVMVTHEGAVAQRADRIVRMLDGRIAATPVTEASPAS